MNNDQKKQSSNKNITSKGELCSQQKIAQDNTGIKVIISELEEQSDIENTSYILGYN